MTDKAISVDRLAPSIGAEVKDIDLTCPLSDFQLELIRGALLEHLVIFFRDQNLTPAEHKAFARRFGKLHIHPAPLGILDGDPEIIIVEASENSRRSWRSLAFGRVV
jgi:taurine dioxygenase